MRINPPTRPETEFEMPARFAQALDEYPGAKQFFESLAKTYRRQYLYWIAAAKREDTRQKRIAESIELLSAGKKLGLK
ncbi:MAG: YdeI/OmpD-associated family protein [Anaerolineales bacterium]|nr:YdeI/OmpD-associated family protein [Anaerolineales bacterium]